MKLAVALVVGGTLLGCRAHTKMEPGVPLEVRRGYCIIQTEYKQQGEVRDRDSVMQRLDRNPHARPLLASGGAYAIGSIVAAVLATPAIVVGAYGKQGVIEMSDGTSTALLAGGIGVGTLSWGLCIASDGKYAAGVQAYNAQLPKPVGDEEGAPEPEETWR